MRATLSAAALCLLLASPALAIRPDECEQQRALFPKEWNDVTKEKPLFYCWSHYSGALRVTLGAVDDKGRRLLSLVPLEEHRANAKQDKSKDVSAYGSTRSRPIGCNKENISPPLLDSGNRAGFAARCQDPTMARRIPCSSWTTSTPSPTGPMRGRSTTKLRGSACSKAMPMSANRSSSAISVQRTVATEVEADFEQASMSIAGWVSRDEIDRARPRLVSVALRHAHIDR